MCKKERKLDMTKIGDKIVSEAASTRNQIWNLIQRSSKQVPLDLIDSPATNQVLQVLQVHNQVRNTINQVF